jgi:hypothetical protein
MGPPSDDQNLTPEQLRTYFASPEYRSLPRAEQRAKVRELRELTGGAAPVSPDEITTPEDLRAYFDSAAFKRLSPAERKAKVRELQAQRAAGG